MIPSPRDRRPHALLFAALVIGLIIFASGMAVDQGATWSIIMWTSGLLAGLAALVVGAGWLVGRRL